ncbi:MAG: aspartate aminotransferase family protein [Anaerolineae bacterium CG_4_9_14_3_um_filter_57_17]|nr:acetyl ornithine aminotransferase family protein [bacterium]NCT19910.1 acetyl ornithine aminotransferase family protein [bacterium]OIO86014.1 MAG: aspartate aminotransferase family protein [Anaerolineae bacterium CG2_30_57_67]PJB65880.1 MAG: aspartate aminotransferase family protein [Anaerolineae bacterium CG_4_9_14_3_um_filter_57_17]
MEAMKLPGPKGRAMLKRDSAVISPSYPRDYPFVMDHGKGSWLWDVDGNQFLDFMAGIAVNSTGHAHPEVVKAIQDQAEKFIHISSDFYHQGMIELGEKLDKIAPMQEAAVSFLTNSGTESIETAIKLARYKTERTNFIGFTGGFHGRTMGAVTFTASKSNYHKGFYPLMNGVVHAPFPNPYRPILERKTGEDYGETVVRYIEEQIFRQIVPAEEVAAILLEPIQGEGGYIVPPAGFFPALRALCDKYGILLIADEVQSGMGRTGKWWAIENFGVEPDIFTTAKGIASGMPLGACVARKSVMTWERGSHGNTYGGNPLACAAALKTIELLEREYLKNAAEVGQYALDALREIAARHPSIGEVRGLGLMIGVEFVTDRETKEPAAALRDAVVHRAFERGLLLLGCSRSVIRIAPPLSISKDEINQGLKIFEEAVGLAEKK